MIVEAINRGVIPIGLASTIDKELGGINNPIVELLEQVARKELSEKATAFKSVNVKLADPEAMDQHLSGLMEQQPGNTDIAAAAAIFAFLRNDIETAATRFSSLDSISGADYESRAADVNLYLAAGFAKKHKETITIEARLAKRAAESGKKMNDQWKQFFEEKKQTSDEQAGLQPTKTLAELPWSDLAVIHQQVTGGPKIGGTSDKPALSLPLVSMSCLISTTKPLAKKWPKSWSILESPNWPKLCCRMDEWTQRRLRRSSWAAS